MNTELFRKEWYSQSCTHMYVCIYIYICYMYGMYIHSHINAFMLSRSVVSNFSRQECWSGLPFPPPGDPPASSGVSCVGGWEARVCACVYMRCTHPLVLPLTDSDYTPPDLMLFFPNGRGWTRWKILFRFHSFDYVKRKKKEERSLILDGYRISVLIAF